MSIVWVRWYYAFMGELTATCVHTKAPFMFPEHVCQTLVINHEETHSHYLLYNTSNCARKGIC